MSRGEKGVCLLLAIAFTFSLLLLDFLRARRGLEATFSWHIPATYSTASRKIDSAIDRSLLELGIKQGDLIKQYWEEREANGTRWVLATKEIRVPPTRTLSECYQTILKEVRRVGGRIIDKKLSTSPGEKALTLTIGYGNKITHLLTLRQGTLTQEANLKARVTRC